MRDRSVLLAGLAILCLTMTTAGAQGTQRVRCSIDNAPGRACTMTDRVRGGVHHMVFEMDGRRVTFVGRSQTGWWSGELDGRPAMGYERNRGNMVISTTDLTTVFAWWYPGREHGTY